MKFYKKFLFGKKNIEVNLTNLIYKKKSVYFWIPQIKRNFKIK